ncbi:MAG TPA: flagellar basal body P-ring formation protein FlgA, partial [Burkholderiales bacterium]|nr:flagellar basal body P-ring formation protein FlgA [Burkholderiales bacterium]
MTRRGWGLWVMTLACVHATGAAAERPDAVLVKRTAEQFVARETAGLPGRVTYTVGALDAQLAVPACQAAEAFLPAGGRLWG